MCSIGEDDFGDEGGEHAMLEQLDILSTLPCKGTCKKCGAFDEIYKLKCRAEECSECFLSYARHKFRAALGSSKVLPRNAEVLLIFDGTTASMVLLDMLHFAQTQNAFKRLHCFTRVLFIDESSNGIEIVKYQKYVEEVHEFLMKYTPFECFITSIDDSRMKTFNFDNLTEYFEYKKNLNTIDISKFKSLTSRKDFLKHYTSHIIAKVALELKCNFTFVSDTSTNLAAQLLSSVALGRGSSAALDVALLDDRLDGNVKLIRPLRDLNDEELQLYLRARKLTQLQSKCEIIGAEIGESLQSLTNAFVDNLQKNFPSTVSTIFRTGNKIMPSSKLEKQFPNCNKNSIICTFCGSPLDFTDSPTLMAVEFSRLVSEIGKMPQQFEEQVKQQHMKQLCHACSNLQLDSVGINIITDRCS